MKNNTQKIRPAVLYLCAFLSLGIAAIAWQAFKPEPELQHSATDAGMRHSQTERQKTEATQPASPAKTTASNQSRPPVDWGIEMVGIYHAVGGRVLDLRYRIMDAAKAALLPNEPGQIYLIDEATGTPTGLPNSPKTASIPQNPQKLQTGRNYSLSFPNMNGRFKPGSKVTVVIGSMRAEHIVVQ